MICIKWSVLRDTSVAVMVFKIKSWTWEDKRGKIQLYREDRHSICLIVYLTTYLHICTQAQIWCPAHKYCPIPRLLFYTLSLVVLFKIDQWALAYHNANALSNACSTWLASVTCGLFFFLLFFLIRGHFHYCVLTFWHLLCILVNTFDL